MYQTKILTFCSLGSCFYLNISISRRVYCNLYFSSVFIFLLEEAFPQSKDVFDDSWWHQTLCSLVVVNSVWLLLCHTALQCMFPQMFLWNWIFSSVSQNIDGKQVLEEIRPDLETFGHRVATDIYSMGRQCELQPPKLESFDAWGRRVDEIQTCQGWRQLHDVPAEEGLISIAFERKYCMGSGGILLVILASKSLKIYIILFCYEFGKYCKTKNTPARGFPFWPVTSDFHCLWMAQLPASASQRIAVLNAVIGFTDMPIHLYWLQLHLRGKTLLAKNCLAVFLFTDWLKDFFLGRLKS